MPRRPHFKTFAREYLGEGFEDVGIIVHHQDDARPAPAVPRLRP
jgi:hypothetical protein